MKPNLIKNQIKSYSRLHYIVNGTEIEGIHLNLRSDYLGISGNCSGIRGNFSGLSGDCSGIRGNCSGFSGDLDSCEITEEERKQGINIIDLLIK